MNFSFVSLFYLLGHIKAMIGNNNPIRRNFFNYGTMIGVFAFPCFTFFCLEQFYNCSHMVCVLITWIMEMHFQFNCHFFSRYMRFVLELNNYFKSLSQSFLWHGNFTSRKPPLLQLCFQLHLDYKI
jgi:hypothetical protein